MLGIEGGGGWGARRDLVWEVWVLRSVGCFCGCMLDWDEWAVWGTRHDGEEIGSPELFVWYERGMLGYTGFRCRLIFFSFAHFLIIVRTSSSASWCDRPTRCGWCLTLLPYTIATLNWSTIVLWMALQKSSTVHAVLRSTTGAV